MRARAPKWEISGAAFEKLLAALDPDPERAAQAYESLRGRLVKLFEWRNASDPRAAADRTLDRVARHLEQGEEIRELSRHALAVARKVVLELRRESAREAPLETDVPAPPHAAVESDRTRCFDHCLAELPAASRELILRYYQDERRAKIDHRRFLAEKLGIGPNALRIRTHRIRAQLDQCMARCLENRK